MSPEKIGRYLLQAEIGRGLHSMVYRASNPLVDRELAIKVLRLNHLTASAFDTFRQGFELLASQHARLSHPNLLPLLDYGHARRELFVVMPFMPGGSLEQRLTGAPISLSQIRRISQDLAGAIDYAHNGGLVLGSLRPSRLLFDQNDDLVVSTFSFSSLFRPGDTSSTGGITVALGYLSPEQLRGQPAAGKSDIYALGCVLFETMTGKPPYSGRTPAEVLSRHTGSVPHIRDLNPNLPSSFDRVFSQALAFDPADRFSTAGELVQRLTATSSAKPPSPPPPPPTVSEPPGQSLPFDPSAGFGYVEMPADETFPAAPAATFPDLVENFDPDHPFENIASGQAAERPPSPAPRPPVRALNANFEDGQGHVLEVKEHLLFGRSYTLLVDVGLPWEKIPNLLGEKAIFPEDRDVPYLSTSDRRQGWFDLEVVFVSQDFEPNLVSGRIRLPVASLDRSRPYIEGKLADSSGPLRLSLRAPLHREGSSNRARGRLCLYYGAQVLQSALVDVGLRTAGHLFSALESANNRAFIDYVLTPGFEKVGRNLSQRLRSGKDGSTRLAAVKAGLLLNDDLSGTHRILLKVDDRADDVAALPPAWKAYDATAISNKLEEVRSILANPSGQEPDYTSDAILLDKFKADLTALAKLGAGLYSMLLQGITPAENIPPLVWRKRFRSALQPGDVIQLARAGSVPSTHIIPWALIYDYPLELDRADLPLKLCPVIDEQWDPDFAHRKPAFSALEDFTCPHEAAHDTNVICPFGFWGFKYTLEQPISALLGKNWDIEPARRVLVGSPVKMAVAATLDVRQRGRWQQHFQSIHASLAAEYLPASPATERDQLRDSLRAPQLVYILCHGARDGKITYLNIGPSDQDARHTITPELPGSWGEHDFIDVEKWAKARPLVFINGCFTTDLLPELTLNFVSAFRDLLAGCVIGTEIPVTVRDGYLAAEKFFERLARGEDLGQAILGMRWDLLNQGSLLGLAYTPYGMADLVLEREK
ncbi:MAG TPA: serine/threonine-protein kinase [Anaerolineales bacterium]|jgi:serine/threonine protein kinase